MRDVQTVVRVSERSAALQPRHPPLVGSAPAYRVMMTPPTHVCGLAGIASRRATPPGKAQAHAQVRKVGLVDCQLRLYIRRLPRAAWSCVHWRPSLSCSIRRCIQPVPLQAACTCDQLTPPGSWVLVEAALFGRRLAGQWPVGITARRLTACLLVVLVLCTLAR